MNLLRCFILASGSSLEGFDFHRLDNEITIGINYIFKYYTPTILHWQDGDVYNKNNHKPIIDGLDCIKISKPECLYGTEGVYGIPIAETFNGSEGLSKGLYHRYLTGLTALSLAIALGFKPVYLLGYDCRFNNGQGHFYSKNFRHKGDSREHVFKNSVQRFDVFKSIDYIYNCSPVSLLTIFPFADINKILDEPREDINKETIIDEIRKRLDGTRNHRRNLKRCG